MHSSEDCHIDNSHDVIANKTPYYPPLIIDGTQTDYRFSALFASTTTDDHFHSKLQLYFATQFQIFFKHNTKLLITDHSA